MKTHNRQKPSILNGGVAIRLIIAVFAMVALTNAPDAVRAESLGTNWTYQGRITDGGEPVNGTIDLQFILADAATGGNALALQFAQDVPVVDGVFSVEIDFGANPFNGDARWLLISVRPGDASESTTYVPLNPRQPLTVAPYAQTAVKALNADAVTGVDGHSLNAADGLPLDAVFVANNGAVGVGTSTPDAVLSVITGNSSVRAANASDETEYTEIGHGGMNGFINSAGDGNLEFRHDGLTQMVLTDNGYLGVGTSNPTSPLSFPNLDDRKITYFENNDPSSRFFGIDLTGGQLRHWVGTGGTFRVGHYDNATGDFIERALIGSTNNGGQIRLRHSDGNDRVRARTVGDGGEIQIYDTAGNDMATLDVVTNGGRLILTDSAGVNRINAQATADGGQVEVRNTAGSDRVSLFVSSEDAGTINTQGPSGNVNVQLGAPTGFPDNGSMTIRDSAGVTKVLMQANSVDGGIAEFRGPNGNLNINLGYLNANQNHGFIGLHGGSGVQRVAMFVNELGQGEIETDVLQLLGGADIAEPFDINADHEVKPGMVVSIDPDNAGQLRLATQAYDTKVAGVISGAGGVNPAMTLQQKGTIADGDMPVALTGRVYVYVDATGGAVKPGDLLTTSNTAGHAMKVADHHLAHGAIIGKAMTSLTKGKGLVLVLVSLH